VTVRLLLIRHAQADFSSKAFYESPRGRQWDPPLSEDGRAEARALAARLSRIPAPEGVFVSPFRRARETIKPYLQSTGLEATVLEDLGEVYIGDWEGLSFEDLLSESEELARRFRDEEPVFGMAPGSETGEELRTRVVAAIEAAIKPIEGGTVLVLSHGGVINAYLGHVAGVSHDLFFLPDNATISSVLVDGERRELTFLNDKRHLLFPKGFEPKPGPGPEPAAEEGPAEEAGPS
jgi:broad specificity phosphatase PhoE